MFKTSTCIVPYPISFSSLSLLPHPLEFLLLPPPLPPPPLHQGQRRDWQSYNANINTVQILGARLLLNISMIDLKIASKTFLQIEFFVCLIGSKNQRYINKGWMLFYENMYTYLLSKYLYIDINIYMFTFCCSFFFFLSFSFSMSLA